MDAPTPARKCPMCEQPVPFSANFCGTCGVEVTPGGQAIGSGRRLKWYYNIWVILFLMLFVLGPFTLPLVWKHPTMSTRTKGILTAVGFVYACLMLITVMHMITIVKGAMDSFGSTLPQY